MKRKLTEELLKWKVSERRKPLLVEGARQVGKSYIVEYELGAHFQNVLKVNLQNPPKQVAELFEGAIDAKRIISGLELIYETKIVPGETLIFFDEIQDVPRALTSLKYFCEDAPEYHVAAAGSYLGIYLNSSQKAPFPVGKVDRFLLEPMDFEEFLWAAGREMLAAGTREDPEAKIGDEFLIDYLREYMVVGGMPEVVSSWVNQHDLGLVSRIQTGILSDFINDFSKYTDNTTATRIRQIFVSLPEQFAKRNEKFLYGSIRDGARAREYEMAIEWLVNAKLVRRVFRVERGDKTPLSAYASRSDFKLYFLDIGLFRQHAGISSSEIMENEAIFSEFGGLMAEQLVLQQLSPRELSYWTGTRAEVDFVMQDEKRIVPIEVKSGENVHAKSLQVYRGQYSPELALRFSMRDLRYDEGLLNIPLYKIFCTEELIKKY